MKKILSWKEPFVNSNGAICYYLTPIDTNYPFGYVIYPNDNNREFSFSWCFSGNQFVSEEQVVAIKDFIADVYTRMDNKTNTLQEAKDMLIKIADIAGYKVINEDLTIYI